MHRHLTSSALHSVGVLQALHANPTSTLKAKWMSINCTEAAFMHPPSARHAHRDQADQFAGTASTPPKNPKLLLPGLWRSRGCAGTRGCSRGVLVRELPTMTGLFALSTTLDLHMLQLDVVVAKVPNSGSSLGKVLPLICAMLP
mmetsp:Transcript_83641/g.147375  ORF Transcript_83641/g.147375 Transcript_83641/m.147375 type:complete len:144 (+) Transcript_83641:1507-1938(+)